MNWSIKSTLPPTITKDRHQHIIDLLIKSRGLTTKSAIKDFLGPSHPRDLSLKDVGLQPSALKAAATRINQAITTGQTIVVYGDYDADGISATAILWLTLHALGAKAYPFIPDRQRHGYGLSLKGIQEILDSSPSKPYCLTPKSSLIITVDNGIVAHEAATFIKDQGFDLIITDHHQPSDTLPPADVLVHSTQICGAGVAWFLSRQLLESSSAKLSADSLLDLVAIGTIADLMPMIGVNRALAKHGLVTLSKSQRPGLLALKTEAGITDQHLSAYHVGFIIGPRINAMGRLEHGMDALRLLCTTNSQKATDLAQLLGDTNRSRQDLTSEMTDMADQIYRSIPGATDNKIIIIDHQEFHEGVIGLIAGKLTETYSKPSIVISRGEEVSKASARSIKDVNIIELIRTAQSHLINAGGHPGAAGFTIQTSKIDIFRQTLITTANTTIDPSLLQPSLEIDCQVDLSDLDLDLYDRLQTFEPFGIGNPRPVFATTAQITELRTVGRDYQHLKLKLTPFKGQSLKGQHQSTSKQNIDAIGFNLAAANQGLKPGDITNLAFKLDKNEWNGHTNAQLIINDITKKR